jgi:hypothetical protein
MVGRINQILTPPMTPVFCILYPFVENQKLTLTICSVPGITSFDPHSISGLVYPLQRWGNWGWRRLSDMPKVM